MPNRFKKQIVLLMFTIAFIICNKSFAFASSNNVQLLPDVSINFGNIENNSGQTPEDGENPDGESDPNQLIGEGNPASNSIQLLFLITIISLAPSLLIMLTCFTRIIIVLHFVRSALGTQQMPPNQILIGIALFLTLFIMAPTFTEINENAIKPYAAGEISQAQMFDSGMEPIREFMFRQVKDKDLALFADLSQKEYTSKEEIPNTVLIPAFILGEITNGFTMGFFIYMPFIVIDMVVASILMAMGMMMLPPAMISLPFKILIFIMVDGWAFIIEIITMGFK